MAPASMAPVKMAPERTAVKTVCVYCGSGFGGDPAFRAAAQELGTPRKRPYTPALCYRTMISERRIRLFRIEI